MSISYGPRIDPEDMPLTRLQLTWERTTHPYWKWKCWYEMFIPIEKYDIRKDFTKKRRMRFGYRTPGAVTYVLGYTKIGTEGPPRMPDMPFRDGCHAAWDSTNTGMPAFVVHNDNAYEILDSEVDRIGEVNGALERQTSREHRDERDSLSASEVDEEGDPRSRS